MQEGLRDLLGLGGPVLVLLLVLSVLSLAFVLIKLIELLAMGRGEAARAGKRAAEHAPDPATARELAKEAATSQLAKRRSGLSYLELLVNIAPLLGLLGTILGMIDAFQGLELAGASVSPSELAGGIWTALLTTAAGLVLAMLALVALSLFESLIERERRYAESALTHYFAAPRHDEASHAA